MSTSEIQIPEFPYPIAPVAEFFNADAGVLGKQVSKYEPAVLRGFASDWALTKTLSDTPPTELYTRVEQLLGETAIPYTLLPAAQKGDMGIGENLRANFAIDDRVEPAAAFLKVVETLQQKPTGECAYAASMLLNKFPKIDALIPDRPTVSERKLWNRLLWIGSGQHVVDLHFDQMLNLIVMFHGAKRITLLPPQCLPCVYPAPLHRKVGGVPRSMVKLLDVDWARYPRFSDALLEAKQVVLHPGDLLYIPPLWWHYVERYGFNIMVNSWYIDQVDTATVAAGQTALQKSIVHFHDLELDDHAQQQHRAILDFTLSEQSIAQTLRDMANTPAAKTAPTLAGSLTTTRALLQPLPTYWRDWFVLQIEYYVLKLHGEPYPTLPGAMREMADHFKREFKRQARFGPLLKPLQKLARLMRRMR